MSNGVLASHHTVDLYFFKHLLHLDVGELSYVKDLASVDGHVRINSGADSFISLLVLALCLE